MRVSPIELGSWVPNTEEALAFPYQRNGISGNLLITLDEDRIKWDYIPYIDPSTDKTELAEEVPLTCDQIIIRIEGSYDNVPITERLPETENSTNPPALSNVLREYSNEDLKFLAIAHDLAIEYLGKFVNYINFDLGQYWVGLGQMREWGMWYFFRETGANWVEIDDIYNGSVIGGLIPIFDAESEEPKPPAFYYQSKELDKAYWVNMQELLQETRQVDLASKLISNAKRHLANGDYRMATVESIAALEVSLGNFVESRVKKKGVSGKAGRLGIDRYLNLLLPLVLGKDELDVWINKMHSNQSSASGKQKMNSSAVTQQCNDLNQLRNQVVHKGTVPSDKIAIIERGITAIELLADFIRDSESRL